MLQGVAERLGNKKLLVWDDSGEIPRTLDSAKIPYTRLEDPSKLELSRADLVLVGRDMIGTGPFVQVPLLWQSRSGCGVMIFAQTRSENLAGYPLARWAAPSQLRWRSDHPLLADLEDADLQSLLQGRTDAWAVRLPVNEPALEIGWWPGEVPGVTTEVPIDALLLTKTTELGRLVLCQVPLGACENDPRSQIFLRNSIDYLLTRPQPTPPPSGRCRTSPRRVAGGHDPDLPGGKAMNRVMINVLVLLCIFTCAGMVAAAEKPPSATTQASAGLTVAILDFSATTGIPDMGRQISETLTRHAFGGRWHHPRRASHPREPFRSWS